MKQERSEKDFRRRKYFSWNRKVLGEISIFLKSIKKNVLIILSMQFFLFWEEKNCLIFCSSPSPPSSSEISAKKVVDCLLHLSYAYVVFFWCSVEYKKRLWPGFVSFSQGRQERQSRKKKQNYPPHLIGPYVLFGQL